MPQVGEFAVMVSTSSRDVQLTIAVLDLWRMRKSYKVVLQKAPSELHPKVRNHGEGPY